MQVTLILLNKSLHKKNCTKDDIFSKQHAKNCNFQDFCENVAYDPSITKTYVFIRGQGQKGRNGLVKWPSERIVSQGKWRA